MWIVTFILSVFPVLAELFRGDYHSASWQIRIPTCTERYYENREKFWTNSSNITIEEPPTFGGIALLVGFFSYCELVPIAIFVLVSFRNKRLLNKFAFNGTHESLSIRVLLYRNILATQVRSLTCLSIYLGPNPINVPPRHSNNASSIPKCHLRVHRLR